MLILLKTMLLAAAIIAAWNHAAVASVYMGMFVLGLDHLFRLGSNR
jgi:hypothetical protein